MAPPTTTRRSAGGPRALRGGPSKGQSILSFAGKVTKPDAARDAEQKKKKKNKGVALSAVAREVAAKELHAVAAAEEEGESAARDGETFVDDGGADASAAAQEATPDPGEVDMEGISEAEMDKYLRDLEAGRLARTVHQGDLTTSEKILRHFDASSQYGPCIGISRVKRWQRARRLGLDPPREVLAVLGLEGGNGKDQYRISHMEEIMNSLAVGAS